VQRLIHEREVASLSVIRGPATSRIDGRCIAFGTVDAGLIHASVKVTFGCNWRACRKRVWSTASPPSAGRSFSKYFFELSLANFGKAVRSPSDARDQNVSGHQRWPRLPMPRKMTMSAYASDKNGMPDDWHRCFSITLQRLPVLRGEGVGVIVGSK
jgi:hypothetical protein